MSSVFLLPDRGSVDDEAALIDVSSDRTWSYRRLREVVLDLAGCLAAPNTKATLFCFCQNRDTTVIAYLAAIEAGCAVAMLDAGLDADFKSNLIGIYSPEYVFAPPEDSLPQSCGYEPLGPPGFWGRRSADVVDLPEPHRDLALMLPTSGSTGSPKLVRLRRSSVEHNALMIVRALDIGRGERAITSLPIHYSYGLSVLNSHLVSGATIVITGASVVSREFWDAFSRRACTSFAGVPYTYQLLKRLHLERMDLPSLKTMTQAGGKLDNESITHFASFMSARGGRFFVMYGQT